MKDLIICLDVGGTFIKGTTFDKAQHMLLDGIHYYDSHADSTIEKIIENMVFIICDLISHSKIDKPSIKAIGIAFPGPFDYSRGISYIKELNKFDTLYEENIKERLVNELYKIQALDFTNTDIFFKNDAKAFAFGEYEGNISKDRGAYFTLGTGIGSTFIERGNQVFGAYGIPESGMIYDYKFKSSIIDDYLSARGLQKIIDKYYFTEITGKELSDQAECDVEAALCVFMEFGQLIGEALEPFLKVFKPDEIVFGGQISKSLKFFKRGILKSLPQELKQITIRETKNSSMSTLRGLFFLKKEEKNHE